MPYKDPECKRKWERDHRGERNAKRRRQYLAARMKYSVPKPSPDPASDQPLKKPWKTIAGFAVGLGVVLLTTFAGVNLLDTGDLGPSPGLGNSGT